MLKIKIVNSVLEISEDAWMRLFLGQPESFGFYKTLEETNIGPFKYYYLQILNGDKTICIAPMFFIDFKLDMFTPLKFQNEINRIRKIWKSFLSFKTLICGSPVADFGFIGIEKDLSNRQEIFDLINKNMQRFAKKLGASSYGFKDFGAGFNELDVLVKKGFAKVMDYPCAVQRIEGRVFDDFFKVFNSEKRNNLKRKIKKIKDLPRLELEIKEYLDADELARVYDLYLNTYNKSDMHFEKLSKDFFEKIQINMKDIAKFFLYKVENKTIGFNLCFIKEGIFLDKFLGFDYNYSNEYLLFFNRFFLNIDWCYKNNLGIYQSGQTGYEGKLQLGSKLKMLYIYGLHMNPIINFLLKPLFYIAQPKNFDPIFKLLPKHKFE